MRIYVAGPYTIGDVSRNVRAAIRAGDSLLRMGHAPYVPHLNHFWNLTSLHDYEDWLSLDMAWLAVAEGVLRLPGASPGADNEVTFALRRGIPVWFRLKEVPR